MGWDHCISTAVFPVASGAGDPVNGSMPVATTPSTTPLEMPTSPTTPSTLSSPPPSGWGSSKRRNRCRGRAPRTPEAIAAAASGRHCRGRVPRVPQPLAGGAAAGRLRGRWERAPPSQMGSADPRSGHCCRGRRERGCCREHERRTRAEGACPTGG
ncbi:hypothetical protein SEVIR_7G085025v4 [Setaria viridis]